jgi:hypothetical protein
MLNGFFFRADTIEELAAKIHRGHEFQRVPLAHLAQSLSFTKIELVIDPARLQ